jgi:Protein of unknown function (DUF4007)
MSLTFHQTFPLDCENLMKLLSRVEKDPFVSNEQIAEFTGIGIGKDRGKGKVQPTIDYASYSGLIRSLTENGSRKLQITETGRVLMERDPYLKKPASLWVLHFFLSRDGSEAEAWSFFIQDFLPRYGEFTRGILESELGEKFGKRAKIRSINPGVLLNSYTDGKSLAPLRIIRPKSRSTYGRTQPYIPNAFTVAYILAQVWELKRPQRLMVSPAALLEPGDLARTMSLTESELQAWLDALTALGIVGQMREAPPYQVKRQWDDPLYLLRRSFDED